MAEKKTNKNINLENEVVENIESIKEIEANDSKTALLNENEENDVNFKDLYHSLKSQIDLQSQQIQLLLGLLNQKDVNSQKNSQSGYGPTVKIIHLVQRDYKLKTLINLSNITVIMRDFGEERTLTLQQFEELVGKYRRWFDLGIIGVCAGYEDIAEKYGIKTTSSYPLTKDMMEKLGVMDMQTLENIVSKLPKAGKESVLSFWQRKIFANDANYKDIRKLEVLNRISNGALTQVIADINEASKKL